MFEGRFKSAKTETQCIELLYDLAFNRHSPYTHETITGERRCKECQFLKRAMKKLGLEQQS
jgi:hypothetical protein